MIRGQRHPQLLLKPHEVLREGIRTTGQASVTLALREVIAFDKARVHYLTDGRGRQACRHGVLCPKYHVRAHLHHTPFAAFLNALWVVF
jgi:hypothetical protein